jgi:hypothetical protein
LISARNGKEGRSATDYLPPVSRDVFTAIEAGLRSVGDAMKELGVSVSRKSLTAARWLLMSKAEMRLLEHIESQSSHLTDFVEGRVLWGIKTGLNEAFVIDGQVRDRLHSKDPRSSELIKPFLAGEDIGRYAYGFKDRYLIYTFHGVDISKYPAIEAHLKPFKEKLKLRATKQEWYELQQPSYAMVPVLEGTKIIYPEIGDTCRFCIDTEGHYCNNKTFVLPTARLDLLAILNSRVAFFYFSAVCAALESGAGKYLEFRAQYLIGFPVPLQPSEEETSHDSTLHELTQQMLDLHKRLPEVKTAHDRNVIRRQIEAMDREIDQLVYQLYGLTDKEIALVEEATP